MIPRLFAIIRCLLALISHLLAIITHLLEIITHLLAILPRLLAIIPPLCQAWEFSLTTGDWVQLAELPGGGRYKHACSFVSRNTKLLLP